MKSSEIIARVCVSVFTHSGPKAVSAELLVFEWLQSKTGCEGGLKLRKTYPVGHGLPFAKERTPVDIAIAYKKVFPLFTIGYWILRGNMGC